MICDVCGADFPRRPGAGRQPKRCSNKCRSENSRRKARAWAEANPDRNRERAREWGRRNKDRVSSRGADWYARNRDAVLLQCAEYKRANADAVRARNQARRAILAAAPGRGLSAENWRVIKTAYQNRCAYCGTGGQLTVDHVIPLVAGGEHDPLNVVPACLACNCSKGSKCVTDWRPDWAPLSQGSV